MSKTFDVKSEILSAIAKTNDANLKMILLLMLGVLEEIGGKLDAMRQDEQWMRETVLNGHATNHDSDHEWIAKKRKEEEDDAEANRASARKIRDNMIERILWSVLLLAVAGAGLMSRVPT